MKNITLNRIDNMEHSEICFVFLVFVLLVALLWCSQPDQERYYLRYKDFDTSSHSNFSNGNGPGSTNIALCYESEEYPPSLNKAVAKTHKGTASGPRVSRRDGVINMRVDRPCCKQIKAYFKDALWTHSSESVSRLCQQACKTPALSGHSVDTARGAKERTETLDQGRTYSLKSGLRILIKTWTSRKDHRCYDIGPVDHLGRFYRGPLDLSPLLEDSKVSQTQKRGTSSSPEKSNQYFLARYADLDNMTQEDKNLSEQTTTRKRFKPAPCECPCECRVSDRARRGEFRDRKCQLFSSSPSPFTPPEPCEMVKDIKLSRPQSHDHSSAFSRGSRWGQAYWTQRTWLLFSKRMEQKHKNVNTNNSCEFEPVTESDYAKDNRRVRTLFMMLGNQEFGTDEECGETHHRFLVFLGLVAVLMEDQSAWEMARRLRDRLLSLISQLLTTKPAVASPNIAFKKLSRLCGLGNFESVSTLNVNISNTIYSSDHCFEQDEATKKNHFSWSRFRGAYNRQTNIWVAMVRGFSRQVNSTDAVDLNSFGHRLASMDALPPSCRLSPVQLAQAGFHYNPRVSPDAVICHRCGKSYSLEPSARTSSRTPLDVHQAGSPRCPVLPSSPPSSSPGVIRRSSVVTYRGVSSVEPECPEEGTRLVDPVEIGVSLRGQGTNGAQAPVLVNPAVIGVTLRSQHTVVQASARSLSPAAMSVTMRRRRAVPQIASSPLPVHSHLGLRRASQQPVPILSSTPPAAPPTQLLAHAMQGSGPITSVAEMRSNTMQGAGSSNPMAHHISYIMEGSGPSIPMVQQRSDIMEGSGQTNPEAQQLLDTVQGSGPNTPRASRMVQVPSDAMQDSRPSRSTTEQQRGESRWSFQPVHAGYANPKARLESFGARRWHALDIRQLSKAGYFAVGSSLVTCFCCGFRVECPQLLIPSDQAVYHATFLHHPHCLYTQALRTVQWDEAGRGTCRTCRAREVRVLFLPCGHLLSCQRCAQTQHRCPMCRAPVQDRVVTFLS